MEERTTILKSEQHPHIAPDVQASIDQQYTMLDSATVWGFLNRYPQLGPVLVAISTHIPAYFPICALFLRVVTTAPTVDAPDGKRLMLFIANDWDQQHAWEGLDRLMAAWHPDPRTKTPAPISVNVVRGTAAVAVEAAAHRFSQLHGADHADHGDLARRLLESPSGSPDRELARAEFTAALAAEEGTLPNAGGDALAVLARLRRRAAQRS